MVDDGTSFAQWVVSLGKTRGKGHVFQIPTKAFKMNIIHRIPHGNWVILHFSHFTNYSPFLSICLLYGLYVTFQVPWNQDPHKTIRHTQILEVFMFFFSRMSYPNGIYSQKTWANMKTHVDSIYQQLAITISQQLVYYTLYIHGMDLFFSHQGKKHKIFKISSPK